MAGVTVANGAEDPGAVQLVLVMFGIEDAIAHRVPFMDGGVLGVNVPDGARESTHCFAWVDSLPEEVRGIEIGPDDGPNGFAQSQERFRVVNHEARMHLEGDFANATLFCELGCPRPIRENDLVPLVLQDLQEVRGPWAGYPIGGFVSRGAARAAAEINNGVHAQSLSQLQGFAKIGIIGSGTAFVRVDGIAGAVEG